MMMMNDNSAGFTTTLIFLGTTVLLVIWSARYGNGPISFAAAIVAIIFSMWFFTTPFVCTPHCCMYVRHHVFTVCACCTHRLSSLPKRTRSPLHVQHVVLQVHLPYNYSYVNIMMVKLLVGVWYGYVS